MRVGSVELRAALYDRSTIFNFKCAKPTNLNLERAQSRTLSHSTK